MPWDKKPMKDALDCDKPRGGVKNLYTRGFPNGGTLLCASRVDLRYAGNLKSQNSNLKATTQILNLKDNISVFSFDI